MRFDNFIRDFTHSLRMFAKSPAFTLAAVAALTLGIGVNTAIFSVPCRSPIPIAWWCS